MLTTLLLAAVTITEGLFEVTTTLSVPGAAPIRSTQCLTSSEPAPVPGDGKACSIFEIKSSGHVVSWHIKCEDARGGLEGTGAIQYDGDHFVGSSVVRIAKGGKQVEHAQVIDGRRIGACASER